jgi:hypothetical protein
MPTLMRPVVLVGLSVAGVAAVGCGLDLSGKLVESGDANPSGIGPSSSGTSSSSGGSSSSNGGGNSSGGQGDATILGSDDAGDDAGDDASTDGGNPSRCNYAGTWSSSRRGADGSSSGSRASVP